MKLVSLKKAMESIGLSEVKINNGFNYQSGFGKDSEGQIWYVNTGDWRWRSQLGTLIRTARDYKAVKISIGSTTNLPKWV